MNECRTLMEELSELDRFKALLANPEEFRSYVGYDETSTISMDDFSDAVFWIGLNDTDLLAMFLMVRPRYESADDAIKDIRIVGDARKAFMRLTGDEVVADIQTIEDVGKALERIVCDCLALKAAGEVQQISQLAKGYLLDSYSQPKEAKPIEIDNGYFAEVWTTSLMMALRSTKRANE